MVANPNYPNGHDNPIGANTDDDDSFRLVAEQRKQVQAFEAVAREAIQAFYTDPQLLAAFIERHETPVYVLRGGLIVQFILWLMGLETGFIPQVAPKQCNALRRFLTLWDCLRLNRRHHQTRNRRGHSDWPHGLFILTRPLFTTGFLSHQLHHWLAYRAGLEGYSDRSRRLYKQFWGQQRGVLGSALYTMDLDDVLALKAAVRRDLEALRFLRAISEEVLIPAKQAKHISDGNASA